MVHYRLTYFNLRGRGEPIRLLLHAAGQEFEDVRVEGEKWPELKPKSPLGQMPFLDVIDGNKVVTIGQSVTIRNTNNSLYFLET
jgi:glutathione S-transferase